MPEVLLIRHAKAAPFGVEPGDHSRPLAKKGRKQAGLVGEMLIEADSLPTRALVSTALRTRETLQYLQLPDEPETRFLEELYLAAAEEIEREIWHEIQDTRRLAVIGHNPGLGVLAWQWLQGASGHEPKGAQKLRMAYKTAYAALFDWNEGRPKLIRLFDPREGKA